METQTNISPAPEGNSSGANTVLLVVIILLILGGAYWWYTHRKAAPASNTPNNINIDVKLPSGNPTPAPAQ